MGSLQLDCPLCCSETFPCHDSLKYHLLSITDNLICPACGKRFEKIFDLAMHLGSECLDVDNEVQISSEANNLHVGNQGAKSNERDLCVDEVNMTFPIGAQIKEELSDSTNNENELNSVVTNSILAKALMKHTVDNVSKTSSDKVIAETVNDNSVLEEAEEENEASEDELYYCSSCAIKFTSIEEHLQKFHEGHQVFLEEEKEDSGNDQSDVSTLCVIRSEDYDEDEDMCDNDNVEIEVGIKTSELLNTIQEEECVDKDGRLYTRKVVKIEKFWNDKEADNNPSQSNPVIAIKDDSSQETILLENIQANASSSENSQNILEIYQCFKCAIRFTSMDTYYKHKCSGSRLDTTKYKKCKICKACFVNSKFLTAHMKTHKPKRSPVSPDVDPNPPFICEICNTEFPAYKSLRLHRRMHEPIKAKDIEPPVSYGMQGEELGVEHAPREMFICQICNKPYDKEYEEAHKKFHSKEVDFNCDICNRKFYTQENLDMHMRAHSDTKKFTCSYCKKGFLTSEKLEGHMSSKCQKRQYECQYCGRRFARPHEKVKHERIHTGEKPHVCEICGKAFRVSYCLTLHMRTHSGTRPYKCDHCGKRFKAHSVYNHHLLTHSEDRKYKCTYCPKTFKTGVQLAGHKNSHTKPFTCTECNRPFASLYAVRAHMETHQRQNNLKYRCWLCGASYARAFALRDHIREQHSGEQESNMRTETIILDNDDYPINENVESGTPILADGDESMLIDIGSEAVDNMEMPEVQVAPELQDNDT